MGNWVAPSWKAEVGISHTPAYQVSGRPFASGSIQSDFAYRVVFPYVTRWFRVVNRGPTEIKVGFSEAGIRADGVWTGLGNDAGTYYFVIPSSGSTDAWAGAIPPMEIKISELWISGTAGTNAERALVDVIAGLTTVPCARTSGSLGPNFSGSIGV